MAACLVALVTASAAPARAQTSQELVGLPLVAAEDRLKADGRFFRIEGLPKDVARKDALVVGVSVINDPDGSIFVLLAGTRVPDVVGRGLEDAQQAVRDVALEPALSDEPDDATAFDTDGLFVTAQRPSPASLLPFNKAVLLQPGVRVPDLRGLSLAEAEAAAADSRLKLIIASGPSNGLVTSQRPPPNNLVRIASSVGVRLDATVTVPLVTVPDLAGLSTEAARERLAKVDLVLSATVGGDPALATATGQTPAADTRVPRRSTVAVSFAALEVTDEEGLSLPVGVLRVAVLILALLAATTLSRGVVRRRRERRWLREQVRYQPSAGQLGPPRLQELDPAAGFSVRAEARPDPGHQILEEVHP